MGKYLISTVITGTLLFASAVCELGNAQTLTVKPNWPADQSFEYVLQKSQEQSQDGSPAEPTLSRTEFSIKVAKAAATGHTLELIYGGTTVTGSEADKSPLLQPLSDLSRGLKVVLNVDPKGGVKLANWRELRTGYADAIQQLAANPPVTGMTDEDLAKLFSNLKASLSTEAQISGAATRDIQLLFIPLGKTFDTNKEVIYGARVPNPLGGRELPTYASFQVKSIDGGIATIHWKQSLAPEETKRAMEDAIKSLERKTGKPVPEADALKDMKISDAAMFKVETDSGWVISAKHGRMVRIGQGYQKETTSIQRKPAA
jgi:hypothetical protein